VGYSLILERNEPTGSSTGRGNIPLSVDSIARYILQPMTKAELKPILRGGSGKPGELKITITNPESEEDSHQSNQAWLETLERDISKGCDVINTWPEERKTRKAVLQELIVQFKRMVKTIKANEKSRKRAKMSKCEVKEEEKRGKEDPDSSDDESGSQLPPQTRKKRKIVVKKRKDLSTRKNDSRGTVSFQCSRVECFNKKQEC
jgi:hypothetical protein